MSVWKEGKCDGCDKVTQVRALADTMRFGHVVLVEVIALCRDCAVDDSASHLICGCSESLATGDCQHDEEGDTMVRTLTCAKCRASFQSEYLNTLCEVCIDTLSSQPVVLTCTVCRATYNLKLGHLCQGKEVDAWCSGSAASQSPPTLA